MQYRDRGGVWTHTLKNTYREPTRSVPLFAFFFFPLLKGKALMVKMVVVEILLWLPVILLLTFGLWLIKEAW